ncbi:hypothetical protein N9W79_00360 [bacterium]|nr:hypothetical protein [bacterium]
MQNSPNSSFKTNILTSASLDTVWEHLTTEKKLTRWLCNSCNPSLVPGSSWEPLGVNFWGGELNVLIASEKSQLALRWSLEGFQSLVHFRVSAADADKTLIELAVEYPVKGEFGFGKEANTSTSMKILWDYHMVQLKLLCEGIKPVHRVDILKPEGLAIRFFYTDSDNPELSSSDLMKTLFTPPCVELFKRDIHTLEATGTQEKGMDEISWQQASSENTLTHPISINKETGQFFSISTKTELNSAKLLIEVAEKSIEFKQDGFNKRVELQNLFELEWTTLINLVKYYAIKGTKTSDWLDVSITN